jgi:hypothetical protein
VADQIRSCLEEAVRMKLHVPREHVFYDLAVSGTKERRPGLDLVSLGEPRSLQTTRTWPSKFAGICGVSDPQV